MTTITFKNAMGIEMTSEIKALNERLMELERYEILRKSVSDANPETMTTGKDITVANEIAAIKAAYAEEKKRDFLAEAIAQEMERGAYDREEAMENIATETDRRGPYNFASDRGLLDLDNSSETFMIAFMSAFNKELGPKY